MFALSPTASAKTSKQPQVAGNTDILAGLVGLSWEGSWLKALYPVLHYCSGNTYAVNLVGMILG